MPSFSQEQRDFFSATLARYFADHLQQEDSLSLAQRAQLQFYIDGEVLTPQVSSAASAMPRWFFEVNRSISRWNSFRLLQHATQTSEIEKITALHQQFTKNQHADKRLTLGSFNELVSRMRHDLPKETQQTAVGLTCFLTLTRPARALVQEHAPEVKIDDDSEKFLTQLSQLVLSNGALRTSFPILIGHETEVLQYVNKAFLANAHLRWLMFTEGTKAMVQPLLGAEPDTLAVWRWRWLTNLMGFNGGPNATYYSEEVHQITMMAMNSIDACISHGSDDYLARYLDQRATCLGLEGHEPLEKRWLTHLATQFITPLLTTGKTATLAWSYQQFNAMHPENQLVQLYADFCQDAKNYPPTYVPGLLNNAYQYFKSENCLEALRRLLNAPATMRDDDVAFAGAVFFACQIQQFLYRQDFRAGIINCMVAAQSESLAAILPNWLNTGHLNVTLQNRQLHLAILQAPTPATGVGVALLSSTPTVLPAASSAAVDCLSITSRMANVKFE